MLRLTEVAFAPLVLIAAAAILSPAAAKTLSVGPDQEFKLPSDAARAAADGDTVSIAPQPGGYFDCATWRQSRLTIEGQGEGATITDKTCDGKGLFILDGRDVTIRNLTFARARVPDRNGAGIRVQGANLRIERSRFLNNETAILAAPQDASTITILDSEFTDNGRCDSGCTHAVTIDGVAILHIEHSRFKGGTGDDQIESTAQRTELIGNEIADGEAGTAHTLVELPHGGSLVMRDNSLEQGARGGRREAAIAIVAGNGAAPVSELVFSGNRYKNDTGASALFVMNWSGTDAKLDGNQLGAETTPVSSSGYAWFRAKSLAHVALDQARAAFDRAKSALGKAKGLVRSLL
jgi:hypothetical protein